MNRIVAIGEILWDLLPAGPVLGGAPANFAFHAHALGADSVMISRIGADAFGCAITDRFQAEGLRTDCLQVDDQAPTGTVSVHLTPAGDATFTIHEGVAWDRLEADPRSLAAVAAAAAVCFGSLGQRTPGAFAAIQTLISAAKPSALLIFDINLRQHFYSQKVIEDSLHRANVLKLNETELPILAQLLHLQAPDDRALLSSLATRFNLKAVALTRGGRGSLLWREGLFSEHPGLPVVVRDTIGAGDSFTAAFTIGLLSRWPLDLINDRANRVAAYVCSQPGATPNLPADLRAEFSPTQTIT